MAAFYNWLFCCYTLDRGDFSCYFIYAERARKRFVSEFIIYCGRIVGRVILGGWTRVIRYSIECGYSGILVRRSGCAIRFGELARCFATRTGDFVGFSDRVDYGAA